MIYLPNKLSVKKSDYRLSTIKRAGAHKTNVTKLWGIITAEFLTI